jgi:hypothetical protein
MEYLKSDNINRILITLTDFFYGYSNRSDLGLEQSDHINRMITLTVIALSGFYCIVKKFKICSAITYFCGFLKMYPFW